MKIRGQIETIRVGEQELLAIEQQYQIASEDWNEYKLLDGGVLRLKTTVHKIYRIVDEESNQIYDAQGEPQIIVRHRSDVVSSL